MSFLWTWRGSNPRPNGETICFLHAYFPIGLSGRVWGGNSLAQCRILLNFICGTRLPPTISDMLHHADQEASGKTALGWCLVPAPGTGIKPIYYASIKQRERKNFRQINCYRPWLRWPPAGSPHAYIPSRPAVKSSQALKMDYISNTFNLILFKKL